MKAGRSDVGWRVDDGVMGGGGGSMGSRTSHTVHRARRLLIPGCTVPSPHPPIPPPPPHCDLPFCDSEGDGRKWLDLRLSKRVLSSYLDEDKDRP